MIAIIALLITIIIFCAISRIGDGSFLFGIAKISTAIIEVALFIVVFVLVLTILI